MLVMKESNRSIAEGPSPEQKLRALDCFFDPFIIVQISRVPAERLSGFRPPWGHNGIIFDPDSPDAFDVHARFQGYHVSSLHKSTFDLEPAGTSWISKPIPWPAMDKVAPQPLTWQETPGGCSTRACGSSALTSPGGSLRFQDGPIPPAHTQWRPSHLNGAWRSLQ